MVKKYILDLIEVYNSENFCKKLTHCSHDLVTKDFTAERHNKNMM